MFNLFLKEIVRIVKNIFKYKTEIKFRHRRKTLYYFSLTHKKRQNTVLFLLSLFIQRKYL